VTAVTRCFSSSSSNDKIVGIPQQWNKIHIHFGTSTGTAQLFAQELQRAIEEQQDKQNNSNSNSSSNKNNDDSNSYDVKVLPLNKTKSFQALDPQALHLFLVSTAGVGEPPAMAQDFFQSLQQSGTNNAAIGDNAVSKPSIHFGVFGLGNLAAHPNHYNVAGRTLHEQLSAQHNFQPWLPLTLGDDSDCLEEDFDEWQATILQKIQSHTQSESTSGDDLSDIEEKVEIGTGEQASTPTSVRSHSDQDDSSLSTTPSFGQRLSLIQSRDRPSSTDCSFTAHNDLWEILPSYYHADTQRWKVQKHTILNPQPMANGLHEIQLALTPHPSRSDAAISYDAGDHLVIYPVQPDYLVEAYLEHWDISVAEALQSTVEPIEKKLSSTADTHYPHPTGISLYDTLRHCVDLVTPPSPRLARLLLGRDDLDYKRDVFAPRTSPLALVKQSTKPQQLPLDELLFHLPRITPRFYSIASSSLMHPNSLYLVYRPVRFVTGHGYVQQGLCTSYLNTLQKGSTLMAYVNRNPSFRLPIDSEIPIILMAGGCGVAALRSLVEEINVRGLKTPVYIFLGFRNPSDAAYLDVMQSIEPKLLDVAWSQSSAVAGTPIQCVNDRVKQYGEVLYDLLEHQGAYLYLCGGARTFGASIQRELHDIYAKKGHSHPTEALQELVRQGRYCEDLAD
jgi:NADPH-ferrihemoprotein reductase